MLLKIHKLKKVYSIVMAPAAHPTTKNEISSLKSNLNEAERERVIALSLEEFIAAIRVHCKGKYLNWIDWFNERYLNF